MEIVKVSIVDDIPTVLLNGDDILDTFPELENSNIADRLKFIFNNLINDGISPSEIKYVDDINKTSMVGLPQEFLSNQKNINTNTNDKTEVIDTVQENYKNDIFADLDDSNEQNTEKNINDTSNVPPDTQKQLKTNIKNKKTHFFINIKSIIIAVLILILGFWSINNFTKQKTNNVSVSTKKTYLKQLTITLSDSPFQLAEIGDNILIEQSLPTNSNVVWHISNTDWDKNHKYTNQLNTTNTTYTVSPTDKGTHIYATYLATDTKNTMFKSNLITVTDKIPCTKLKGTAINGNTLKSIPYGFLDKNLIKLSFWYGNNKIKDGNKLFLKKSFIGKKIKSLLEYKGQKCYSKSLMIRKKYTLPKKTYTPNYKPKQKLPHVIVK